MGLKILLTNDDGIDAEGLQILAEAALTLQPEKLWIVAPASQCSAMSQRITLRQSMLLKKEDYPVAVTEAYSLGGTPADCVKVALAHLYREERPDILLSGMNFGYNSGFDIAYSGTLGAALEGVMNGIPSYAFSNAAYLSNDLAVAYLPELLKKVTGLSFDGRSVINVNIPGCPAEECRGILWDRKITPLQYYRDSYSVQPEKDGAVSLSASGIPAEGTDFPEGTDIAALQQNYISVGRVYSMVLQ